MDDDLDYHLDEPNEDEIEIKKKIPKKVIIIIICIVILLLIAVILILYFLVINKKDSNENNNKKDEKTDIHFFYNISTATNGKIPNTFREGGKNYNDSIGNINDGEDYEANDRNDFDLCIPASIMKRKNKYNIVFLYIHGGAWIKGEKKDISTACSPKTLEIISASMSYTLLNSTYGESSIFRIMDDVNAVIYKLKEKLKEEGFNENKLELFLQGDSAGAHICLLYSNIIKEPIIPIKFIYNVVGPVSMSPFDFLIAKQEIGSLSNIEPESIENAWKYNTIMYLNLPYTINHFYVIQFMNLLLGKKFDDNINQLYDFINDDIKFDSPDFKDLLEKVKYAFPIVYINEKSPPVLCGYGGKDIINGIKQYSLLKTAYVNAGISDKIELVYFRYGNHDLGINTEYGQKKLLIANQKRDEMIKKYFTHDD